MKVINLILIITEWRPLNGIRIKRHLPRKTSSVQGMLKELDDPVLGAR